MIWRLENCAQNGRRHSNAREKKVDVNYLLLVLHFFSIVLGQMRLIWAISVGGVGVVAADATIVVACVGISLVPEAIFRPKRERGGREGGRGRRLRTERAKSFVREESARLFLERARANGRRRCRRRCHRRRHWCPPWKTRRKKVWEQKREADKSLEGLFSSFSLPLCLQRWRRRTKRRLFCKNMCYFLFLLLFLGFGLYS